MSKCSPVNMVTVLSNVPEKRAVEFNRGLTCVTITVCATTLWIINVILFVLGFIF